MPGMIPPIAIVVQADQHGPVVSRHLYGHFAEHLGRCVYEGLWVGEDSPIPNTRGIRNDVVAALKALRIPNLRWPGGCFADTYHWRDGVGPRARRPEMVNIHWGGTTENNHFGTHEFLDLCAQLGCEPYICGNVGSGTVREMAEWLEYLTHKGPSPMAALRQANGRAEPWPLAFWAVGNENWGCGGEMTAEYYANEFRRFQVYCRHFGGKKLYKVACGFHDAWNEVLMREAARFMDGLSIHYYTFPGDWGRKGRATGFSDDEWYVTLHKALGVDEFLAKTAAIMDRHDPSGRVGMVLDEWGAWYDATPGTNPGFLEQQNSLRDALLAAASFHVFHKHVPRLHMANIAQTVNVLQAMVLTDGPRMLLTPTYHVFEMFQVHQDGTRLPVALDAPVIGPTHGEVPLVTAAATRDGRGRIHLTLCNLSLDREAALTVELKGAAPRAVSGRILTHDRQDAHNTFEHPNEIAPRPFAGARLDGSALVLALPPRSIVALEIG